MRCGLVACRLASRTQSARQSVTRCIAAALGVARCKFRKREKNLDALCRVLLEPALFWGEQPPFIPFRAFRYGGRLFFNHSPDCCCGVQRSAELFFVVVEVTPRSRRLYHFPSTATLKKQILRKRVMITGWLFYDSMHEGNAIQIRMAKTSGVRLVKKFTLSAESKFFISDRLRDPRAAKLCLVR
jgi:hypothetical protein